MIILVIILLNLVLFVHVGYSHYYKSHSSSAY